MARVSKNPEQRREEILNTADMLFAQKGFDDVRVSDIVSQMGVAQGTFYYYFASKDEVFLALLDQKWEQLAQFLRQKLNLQEDAAVRLSTALAFLVMPEEAVLKNPAYRLLFDPAASGAFHPQFDGARVKSLLPVMREGVAYGVARGAFSPLRNGEDVVKIVFLGIGSLFHETPPEAAHSVLPAVCETVERVLGLAAGTIKLQF